MNATETQLVPELPPIVLLVDRHRDMLDQYSRCFEDSGLWVAATSIGDEAIAAAEEIKPDIIVVDTDTPVVEWCALADSLKTHPALNRVPVIALASSPGEGGAADSVLIKPVDARVLLQRTKELLLQARRARDRSAEMLRRSEHLLQRSTAIFERAGLEADHSSQQRRCPACGSRLDWIERGTIGGITYDYYRSCEKGCGLFCYDSDARKWVKLV